MSEKDVNIFLVLQNIFSRFFRAIGIQAPVSRSSLAALEGIKVAVGTDAKAAAGYTCAKDLL